MEAGEPADLPSFTSLPAEVIFSILTKLSVRTLLRFRCVCKDWNSIITNQSFINKHLLSQSHGLLFSHYFEPSAPSSSTDEKTQHCSFLPDESFSLVHRFKVPLPYSSGLGSGRMLVGSLDGLLCLTNREPYGHEIYLWNPSIREYKTLSGSCLFIGKYCQRFFHRRTTIVLGLGFRAHTSDYIIIRIACFGWQPRGLKNKPLTEAEIYSLSTDSWEKVGFSEDVLQRVTELLSWKYAIVNGDLHWMAMFSDGEGRPYESILSFDVNMKEFREARLPSDYRNGINDIFPTIAIHKGLLAIVLYGPPIPKDENWYVWLWTMEDYGKVDSWRRRTVKTTGLRASLGCTLDGRIMFKKGGGVGTGRIVELLDMDTLQEQQFSILDFQSVHPFKETLVSLEGANASSENVLSK